MTKADLRRYSCLDTEVRQLERLLDTLKVSAHSALAMSYTGMPSSGTWENRQAAIGSRYDELSRKYEIMLEELLDLRQRFESLIETWDPEVRTIFRMIYIEHKTWEQVAEEIHRSSRTAQRILRAAIKSMP